MVHPSSAKQRPSPLLIVVSLLVSSPSSSSISAAASAAPAASFIPLVSMRRPLVQTACRASSAWISPAGRQRQIVPLIPYNRPFPAAIPRTSTVRLKGSSSSSEQETVKKPQKQQKQQPQKQKGGKQAAAEEEPLTGAALTAKENELKLDRLNKVKIIEAEGRQAFATTYPITTNVAAINEKYVLLDTHKISSLSKHHYHTYHPHKRVLSTGQYTVISIHEKIPPIPFLYIYVSNKIP